jgi:hypothetical protein
MPMPFSQTAERSLRIVEDYNVTNVSEKVVRIALSYTDYVNRVICQKHKWFEVEVTSALRGNEVKFYG